jgi:hypothetical protein
MEEELRNAEEADRHKKEEEERQRQVAAAPPAQLGTGPDSQTPASGAEASAGSEDAAAADSSYPYGESYGQVMKAQAEAEESHPAIQPPATGEPVPAAWPVNETYEAEPAVVEAEIPVDRETAAAETAQQDTHKATEPAHNG